MATPRTDLPENVHDALQSEPPGWAVLSACEYPVTNMWFRRMFEAPARLKISASRFQLKTLTDQFRDCHSHESPGQGFFAERLVFDITARHNVNQLAGICARLVS